jgi:hypothetical protein
MGVVKSVYISDALYGTSTGKRIGIYSGRMTQTIRRR